MAHADRFDGDTCAGSLPADCRRVLHDLLQARDLARSAKRNVWELAVELQQLLAYDAGISQLRWMLAQGYAEIAVEITTADDSRRRFRPVRSFAFLPGTCFVLTPAGEARLRAAQSETQRVPGASPRLPLVAEEQPRWLPHTRTVFLGHRLVKQFRVPAANQEQVLNAFQEEGWPDRILDPLPPLGDQDPKRRLGDTIRALNHHQVEPLLRFHGDGTGEGVLWEQVLPGATAVPRTLSVAVREAA
jgi:hypothetical protein